MDPSSIGFLILVVAMGGLIAYAGDNIGKKLGKKRLSFKGMRPRHTATAGTVLAGILISVFTLLLVLAVSSTMRESLLRGNQIRRELQDDQQKLKDLNVKLTEGEHHNSDLTSRNGVLTKRIDEAKKELAKRKADLSDTQTKLKTLQSKVGSLQRRIGKLTTDAAAKAKALDAGRKQLAETNRNLASISKELDINRKRLASVIKDYNEVTRKNGELVQKNDELVTIQKRLQGDKSKLETDMAQITKDLTDLQKAKEDAQLQLNKSQSDLHDVEGQLSVAKGQLSETQNQLNAANIELEQARQISNNSRSQPMIFKMDEEVVRLSVPAGLSSSAANGALTNLIRRARLTAQRRGARSHTNFPEAGIFNHSDPKTHQSITTDMIEHELLKQITGAPKPVVMIATSSFNAFRGETVSLEVSILPNPLVYVAGQLVAESVVEGNKGDLVILQELTSFLQDKIKSTAEKSGMIPIAKSDVSFGQVAQGDVLKVVTDIHNANRAIRLQAYAVGDTYAADPLKLEFRLR